MEALAKWNRAPQAVNTRRGRELSSTLQAEGRAPLRRVAGQEASGDLVVDGARRNGRGGKHAGHGREAHRPEQDRVAEKGCGDEDHQADEAVAEMEQRLVPPGPPGEAGGPDDAERDGGKSRPDRDSGSAPIRPAVATDQNWGASGITRQVAVTSTTAPAMSARLARTASTSAPKGAFATSPVMAPIESAAPMLAASQACSVIR
jgi:hypothetical protein